MPILASPLANAAQVRLKVEGLSGSLEQNVRASLSTIESDEVSNDGRFRARVDESIRRGLKALGYYQPTIEFDFQDRKPPERPLLIAKVKAGEPVLIAGVDVKIQGQAKDDEAYKSFENR